MAMTGIFYTDQLAKQSQPPQGALWDSREAYYPETQVLATIQLSRYGTQNSGQFAQFEQRFAEAYIVSSETPMTTVGTVTFPSRRDSTVYLRTGHLSYLLEVQNSFASAVFNIFDMTPASVFELTEAERRLDVAVFDDEGHVVGTHRAVRLRGGADFDDDATMERVLATARVRSDRDLDVAAIEISEIPHGADFRIDIATRRPVPLP
jgi:hypothetical protein